jgi:cytochrome c oxidase cbb3-type subunit III
MSTGWSLFVIIGTLGTLVGALWLLLANRTSASGTESTGHFHDGIEELDNPLPLWWVGLFVATIVFGALYLVYYPGLGNFSGLGNWTSEQQWRTEVDASNARFAPLYAELASRAPEALLADRSAMQIGRRLYLNNCVTCHGLSARGKFGFPDLTDGHWSWGGDFAAINTTIRAGRTGVMPGWSATLGERGIQDTTQYLLSLVGRDTNAAAVGRGRSHYQAFCLACHGADGRGSTAIGTPDLTNDSWLYGGHPDQIAFTIRNGREGQMPAFEHILGPDRAYILAAYIYSLGRDRTSE